MAFHPGQDNPSVPNRKVIARLYEMASELKGEVERIDANSTLSVSLVKKTQQIERLAKQIKELAKG